MKKLKILQIHKFFRQKGLGGSIGSMFGLIDLLEKNGHPVMVFSSNHNDNRISKYENYFVNSIKISRQDNPPLTEKIKLAFQTLSSKEAAQKLEVLIQKEGRPDIAHLHLIAYHLTPSIIPVLKKHQIPIVQTLHDYQLICPNHKLFINNKICEKCKKKKYFQCALNKCVQNSYSRSFLAMIERYYNRYFRDYAKNVDLFIAPSNFMKKKTAEFGISFKKIIVMPNYIDFKKQFDYKTTKTKKNNDKYALYFGRLAKEKGVDTLIKAFALIKDKTFKLKIVGSGPEETNLKNLTKSLKLNNKIQFLGFQQKKQLTPLIKNASFSIYPSLWYENSPLTIYESLYFNTPVIASNIGGITELIEENVNGYLFEKGQAKDLAQKIDSLTPESLSRLSQNSQKSIIKKLDFSNYYRNLIKTYQSLL
ncbi:MAG: glycosyltransferase [Candidatus Moranbacteria bacterium]|nr:glycosyltransferase [Candidatus Moranbacteria bacterium]